MAELKKGKLKKLSGVDALMDDLSAKP